MRRRYGDRTAEVIDLQRYPGGVAAGLRSDLCNGRFEIVTAGPNPEFGFIGSDPYGTNAYTGLMVPTTPSAALGDVRYLMLLARASFQAGEQSSDNKGVRMVGIRQYAELIARVPQGGGLTPAIFRKEIVQPLWHLRDGNISWHVTLINKVKRDTRNPANADGVMYQDCTSPALLYQTIAGPPLTPTAYTPPTGRGAPRSRGSVTSTNCGITRAPTRPNARCASRSSRPATSPSSRACGRTTPRPIRQGPA
jgi:hypothetical protein